MSFELCEICQISVKISEFYGDFMKFGRFHTKDHIARDGKAYVFNFEAFMPRLDKASSKRKLTDS